MKVSYINKSNETTLNLIEVGEVFRFPNSRRIFMKLDLNGGSRFLTSDCNELWDMVSLSAENPFTEQREFEESHSYTELILCVELASGEVFLAYENSKVEKLNCELLVEEPCATF